MKMFCSPTSITRIGSRLTAILLGSSLLAVSAGPLWAQRLVNETVTRNQDQASLCTLAGGGYVAVWHGDQSGDLDVYARRLDADAAPAGPEMRVNLLTAGSQSNPDVCCDASGGYVVTWQTIPDPSAGDVGVAARRFPAGGPPGPEVAVNLATSLHVRDAPSICCLPAGDHVISWADRTDLDGFRSGIFLRRFDGDTGGPEIQGNLDGEGYQEDPRLCCSVGSFSLLWDHRPTQSVPFVLKLRRFAAAGTPLTGDLDLEVTSLRSDLCCTADGTSRVVWEESHRELRSRVLAPDGTPAGPEETVVEYPVVLTQLGQQALIPAAPDLCCEDDVDDYVVAWIELDYQQLPGVTHAAALGFVDGAPQSTEFHVDAEGTISLEPQPACTDDPTVAAVAWSRYEPPAAPPFARDVYARLLVLASLPSVLEVPAAGAPGLLALALVLAAAAALRLRRRS